MAVLTTTVCLATVVWVGSADAAQLTVQKGDSLWSIANRCGTSVDSLKQLNNLNSDSLKIGQILNVPDQVANQSVRPRTDSPDSSRGVVDRAVAVLDYAKQYIGVGYRSGGESPSGFDCSGYVRYVYKNFGIDLVHTAAGQYNAGSVVKRSELNPGDLVFFNTGGAGINHSGIYVGNNQFIHASTSRGIRIDSMSDSYWNTKFRGASRIL
ncbi:LysM peptidoglycan-binding domain-containing C40 family peptidase [Desulforamulus reducens]|nr:LysM peptidoglycan-binding domain-containing C40 family peptidase [Desulforamulus reducens]